MDMLKCTNQFELLIMQAIGERVRKLHEERDEQQAIRIANAVHKMLGGAG